MKRLFLAFALFAMPVAAAAQDLTDEEAAAIDRSVTEVLQQTGVPSAQIAIVRGGRLVMDRAWGKASEKIPQARPDRPYQIASNSKQFVAALLLMLENDGKLSLDDTVSRWLPEVSGADRITVRQLLAHTSGLQDYWPQDYSFAAMEQPVAPDQIVARWAMKPLDYEPGTRWQYSNTGYVVAGLIAEKAGGAPLWQQLDERIFRPLGIRPYRIDETNKPAFPQGYHRYALGPVRPARPAAPGWLWAAGELSMTAAELAEWNIARMERTLLPREDWEEMERPVRLADGTSNGYGLGVSLRMANGRRVIDHGGESVGFLSQNSVWIDDKLAIAVLTNGDFGGAQDSITAKIADIVLPKAGSGDPRESARTDDARATLEALIAGQFDPARFTANAQYFFTSEALGDYAASLSALGPITAFEATRSPRLRGGFVNRNYRVTFAGQRLTLVTYAEPGEQGRWEQFMVMPN